MSRKSLWWHCEVWKVRCLLVPGKLCIFQFSTMKLVTCCDQSSSIQDLRPSVAGPGWIVGSGGTLQTSATRWSVWCFFSLKRSPVQSLKHLKPCVPWFMISVFMKVLREAMMSCWAVLILRPLRPWAFWQSYFRTPKHPKARMWNFTCLTSKEVLNFLLYFVFFL